jgi:GNAT superfamily N-acetyltransferase
MRLQAFVVYLYKSRDYLNGCTMQDGHPSPDITTEPRLHIKPAGLDDYATIRYVQSAAVRALAASLLDDNEVAAAIDTINSQSYTAALMAKTVFLAELNGDVIGTCAWFPNDDRGHAARIGGLFVLPLFQGHGFGRMLLEHAELDAARHGYERFNAIAPVLVADIFTTLNYTITSFGTSRDVIPGVAVQVAFLRKPDSASAKKPPRKSPLKLN